MLLESQPGLVVVGEATTRAEALAAAAGEHPEIILLDLDLSGDMVLDCIPDLLTAAPGVRILILTGVRDVQLHRRAVALGAMGLVVKEKAATELLQALDTVREGEAWLSPALVADVLETLRRVPENPPKNAEAAQLATLTERERDVIALIGQGLRNKHIADQLYISETTVRHHLTAIFAKLGVSDRLELAIYAYRHDLASLPC